MGFVFKNGERIFTNQSEFRCGMIGGRHDMPFDVFIWPDKVPNDKLQDYEWLENWVKEFIQKNLPKNEDGEYTKSLAVGVTGLTMASASVIKVCSELKVNLSFLHFNMATEEYDRQVIWNIFGSTCPIENRIFNEVYIQCKNGQRIQVSNNCFAVCINRDTAIIVDEIEQAKAIVAQIINTPSKDIGDKLTILRVNVYPILVTSENRYRLTYTNDPIIQLSYCIGSTIEK